MFPNVVRDVNNAVSFPTCEMRFESRFSFVAVAVHQMATSVQIRFHTCHLFQLQCHVIVIVGVFCCAHNPSNQQKLVVTVSCDQNEDNAFVDHMLKKCPVDSRKFNVSFQRDPCSRSKANKHSCKTSLFIHTKFELGSRVSFYKLLSPFVEFTPVDIVVVYIGV